MAIFLADSFAGGADSDPISGRTPDTTFSAQNWAGSLQLTGAGSAKPPDATGEGSWSTSTVGDNVTDYGLPYELTGQYFFKTGPSVAAGVTHYGFSTTVYVGGKYYAFALKTTSTDGVWYLRISSGTAVTTVFPGITANTVYQLDITIANGAQSISCNGTSRTHNVAYTTPTGGCNYIDVGLGGTTKLESMSWENTPPPPVSTYGINATLPALTGSMLGNYALQATFPAFQAQLSGGPKPSKIDATFPMLGAQLRAGATVRRSLPMLTASVSGTTNYFATIDIELPAITAQLSGTTGLGAALSVTLPGITSAARGGGTMSAGLPLVTVALSGTMGAIGSITGRLPALTAEMSATALAYAILEATLPMLVPRDSGRIVSMMPMLEATLTGRTVVAVTYEAYAVNLKPSDKMPNQVTRYTNYPFSQIVRHQNKYYGVYDGDIYLLEGTTDAGTAIPWAFKTAMTDDNTPEYKRVVAARFGGRVGAAATVTLYTDEPTSNAYSYTTPRDATPQNYRQKFGQGVKGRYYALGAAGSAELELDTLEPEVTKLTRRL